MRSEPIRPKETERQAKSLTRLPTKLRGLVAAVLLVAVLTVVVSGVLARSNPIRTDKGLASTLAWAYAQPTCASALSALSDAKPASAYSELNAVRLLTLRMNCDYVAGDRTAELSVEQQLEAVYQQNHDEQGEAQAKRFISGTEGGAK